MKGMKSFTRGNTSNQLDSSVQTFFEKSKWLKTDEAAKYLGTSPAQIRNWVYQGKIKSYKLLGSRLRFKVTDLDLLMEGVHHVD